MRYGNLGNTDLRVSRICMGCMGFGDPGRGQHAWTLQEEDSRKIIRRGLESGINFYDTAIGYQGGTSEQFVGRALRDFSRREDVVVATKFPPRTQEEIQKGVTGQQHVLNRLDTSLKNLGMDYVDLYICHMWDYLTPIEEILEGMTQAVKAGKARYIGISNCFAWQLCKANALAEREGFEKFISIQGHYNLIFREEEREMIPYCQEEHIAVTPYSPLAGGRLSRKQGQTTRRLEQDAYAHLKYDATQETDGQIIARVAEIAEKRGVSMAAVSLAWLLEKGAFPVTGMTRESHLQGAVQAAEMQLTPEETAYLEAPYVPHALVGVMAQNTRAAAGEKQVWTVEDKKA